MGGNFCYVVSAKVDIYCLDILALDSRNNQRYPLNSTVLVKLVIFVFLKSPFFFLFNSYPVKFPLHAFPRLQVMLAMQAHYFDNWVHFVYEWIPLLTQSTFNAISLINIFIQSQDNILFQKLVEVSSKLTGGVKRAPSPPEVILKVGNEWEKSEVSILTHEFRSWINYFPDVYNIEYQVDFSLLWILTWCHYSPMDTTLLLAISSR